MNILLIYPQYPDSFWSFKHAMRFISKKAAIPPLGLITIVAMLPPAWHKKVVDMNISTLNTGDILWADYVFISAMSIQKESVSQVIRDCLTHKTKIVAGGPLFSQDYENCPLIDHFILNEAEITLPLFLNDLASGNPPEKVYKTDKFADLSATPVPDYSLLSMKDYVTMNLQVSRGCPYKRLKGENRLVQEASGNNAVCRLRLSLPNRLWFNKVIFNASLPYLIF